MLQPYNHTLKVSLYYFAKLKIRSATILIPAFKTLPKIKNQCWNEWT